MRRGGECSDDGTNDDTSHKDRNTAISILNIQITRICIYMHVLTRTYSMSDHALYKIQGKFTLK